MAEYVHKRWVVFLAAIVALILVSRASSDVGQVEGRVGDGMIRLTWIGGSGKVAGYRIYRRDYGLSTHYSLRATIESSRYTFEDSGLDNGLPYFYKVVPVLANGAEASAIGELGLCPMRAPVWEHVSVEPAIAAADVGIAGAQSVGRPGCVSWDDNHGEEGLWYVVSTDAGDVIGHADWVSVNGDGLDNPARGVWIGPGEAGQWDAEGIGDPDTWGRTIIYSGLSGGTWRIGAAQVKSDRSLVDRRMILDVTTGRWDSQHVRDPVMANGGAIALLYYSGSDGTTSQIGLATWSGQTWVKNPANPVLSPGQLGEWDSAGVSGVYVVEERLYPPLFTMYYTGTDGAKYQIGYATSVDGVHWAKHVANPVLPVGPTGSWCSAGVGHPCGYDHSGRTHLWFEGTDGTRTGIGRAVVYRSRVFGRHTALFGPEWFDTSIEHFNMSTMYDALYDLLIKLNGFQGSDYQAVSYYSRVVAPPGSGNPITFGLGFYGTADYPSYPRVSGDLAGLFLHEAAHSFKSYLSPGVLGAICSGNDNKYEDLVAIDETYALEQLATNFAKWGLTAQQVVVVAATANAQRDADIFRVLAGEYGWGIWEAFFQACRPGIIPSDISQSATTSARKNTLMICMLSVACRMDLRSRFRAEGPFANQIDDAFYNTYYPRIAAAMAGERVPPAPPSGVTARIQPGPRVRLSWAPSPSQDLNHYNVYSDNATGGVDSLSPLGEGGSPWMSPVLVGGRTHRFTIRAVDHWGNEEKNESAVVSVFVPQSPSPFFRDWLVLGPFSNSDAAALMGMDYTMTGEALLDPFPGQSEATRRWRRASTPWDVQKYRSSLDADMVDLRRVFHYPSMCVSYAFTRVFTPDEMPCYLRVSNDDDCRIWLNGTLVHSMGYTASEVSIPVVLTAGWNRLCLKVCNYGGEYAFTARLCEAQGGEPPGVVWSVDAPGSRPVASLSTTELAFNDVRIGRNASLAVNVLNRGTGALTLSNIKVRGESASEFSCSSQELNLAAGTAGQLVVSFVPAILGVKSAEFVAATNDPNLPILTIALTGLGRNNALYVNDESSSNDIFTTAVGNDQNSGLDPGSPLRRLSTALERFSLQEGDLVYVDAGLYPESVSVFSTDHQFTIRGAARDLTIIDGGRAGPCMTLDNVTDIHIEQLTLQHGKGLEGPWITGRTWGGALLAAWTDVSLCDVALKDSTADYGGGGLFAGGNVELRNVLVSGNEAADQGGGLYFGEEPRAGSRHYIEDCNLIGNQAKDAGGGLFGLAVEVKNTHMKANQAGVGGGARLERRAVLDGCPIISNRADVGGGVDCGDSVRIVDCNITGNTANDGGGVYARGQALVSRCTIAGNSAINGGSGGGVYCLEGGTVQDCAIQGNATVCNWGGGVCLVRNGVVKNTIISGNSGTWGGGVCCYYGGTLWNCTVVGNLASTHGGGVHCLNGGTVTSTILYSNRAPKGSNYFTEGKEGAYAYCRATPKMPSGPGNIDVDPGFADSGGWDANGTLDALDDDFWVDGDYHLKSQAGRWDPMTKTWVNDPVTSPCIDAGDPSGPLGDEPMPNGGRINMGAYGGTVEASKSYYSDQ